MVFPLVAVSHCMSASPFRAVQLNGASEPDGAGGCLFEGEVSADRLRLVYSTEPVKRRGVSSKVHEGGEMRRFPRGGAQKISR